MLLLLLLLWLLLFSFAKTLVLRLDHGVELALLIVTGQGAANLINRGLPEHVDLLHLRIVRKCTIAHHRYRLLVLVFQNGPDLRLLIGGEVQS